MNDFACVGGKLSGFYNFQILDAESKRIKRETGWFSNLITNHGLDRILRASLIAPYCRVGVGSSAPNVNNLQLDQQIASTSSRVSEVYGATSEPPYYGWYRITYEFGVGGVVGNITEVGVSESATKSDLFSRALIVDSAGNPTAVAVQADEILQVVYECRAYPNTDDVPFDLQVGNTIHSGVWRPAYITNGNYWGGNILGYRGSGRNSIYLGLHNGAIGPITGYPSGTRAMESSGEPLRFDGAPYLRTNHKFGLNVANLSGGITSALYYPFNSSYGGIIGAYQCSFDPPISKDNTRILTLQMQHSWDRR